jgi:hypothetical protein
MARKKITRRRKHHKLKTAHRRSAPPAPPTHGPPPLALSIAEFCKAHGISEPMYFKMKKQRLTPKEMAVGVRRLISQEAAAEWRRQREQAAVSVTA